MTSFDSAIFKDLFHVERIVVFLQIKGVVGKHRFSEFELQG